MEKMYSDTSLTALVTVAKIKVHWRSFLAGDNLFQLDEAQQALDKLAFSNYLHYYLEYGQFISEFLEDPNRSGVYMLSGQRYATAAVHFLKHISDHSEQILPSLNIAKWKYTKQKNFPWLWQKLVQQARSSEAAQIFKWRLRRREKSPLDPLRGVRGYEHAFRLALKCLVHVLPKSDISEELTALARRQKFGPLARKDARRKRAVARAIARYLARVES
ncbi:hypothetical protein GALMADRAFT_1129943 [Galerina marginata CBS 339.88]|uniref:Uncharacterized protein n=1 Tax=Galerina marginata (strain CBS 339.88) TaxID=685588 RepID=A0A067S8J1_GALM3|nr:hypothetical protein GALMADRAFT_1129943 [Galerina marginata CBS 339.88]